MNIGCRVLSPYDLEQGRPVPTHVLYSTTQPAQKHAFGPFELDLALNGPPNGRESPLIVFSHGSGSTPWVLRGLAIELVRAGCVALLLEHPGNSRADNSLADDAANLRNRPRHVRLAIEAALADSLLAPILSPSVGIIGHSLGGYTALATAGGQPMLLPKASEPAQALVVEQIDNLRAVVLLAPALPWFMAANSLARVETPLLVRTGEHDALAPPMFVETILRTLPSGADLDYAVVANAGHFSFLTPFPPALMQRDFPPATDPPGFDRAAYQIQLASEIVAFFRQRRVLACASVSRY